MGNKLEAAYKLGQLQAMEKIAYNPTYSQADIDAIRRYNRDVASGTGSLGGVLGAATGVGAVGAVGGLTRIGDLQKEILSRRLQRSQLKTLNSLSPYNTLMGKRPVMYDTSRLSRQISKLEKINKGKLFRSGALKYLKANKGKAALLAAGGYGLGKLLGYGGRRTLQGIDNYALTDVNAQDRY